MFKYLIVILANVCYIQSEEPFDVDKFAATLYPLGDPLFKLEDEVKTLEKYCSGALKDIINEKAVKAGKEFVHDLLKGNKETVDQVATIFVSTFDNIPNMAICKAVKNSSVETVLKHSKELDNLRDKFKVLRDKFVTVLTDAAKPDTKIKPKNFICLVKLWIEEQEKIVPDTEGLRDFAKKLVNEFAKPLIIVLETAKGKADKTCEFPPAEKEPSKYRSLIIPMIVGVYNQLGK